MELQHLAEKPAAPHVEPKGMNLCKTAFLVMGDIVGASMLALSNSYNDIGVIGPVLMVCVGFTAIYTGSTLGRCWVLLQQRYPEFREPVRYPYPAIGEVTYGKAARIVVSIMIDISMYSTCIIYMILASQNAHDILYNYIGIGFCGWLPIVGLFLAPMTWLGTPKDFWFIAPASIGFTVCASLLLLSAIVQDIPNRLHTTRYDNPTFASFTIGIGVLIYAFGGHPVFPTIQNDMENKEKFGISVLIGYTTTMSTYLPVTVLGYLTYGNEVTANLIESVPEGPLYFLSALCFTIHLLFAFVIDINPVCQDMEEYLNIPREFTWKRAVCRTSLVAIAVVIAETIPRFGAIMALVGSSTINILSFILPMVFYMKLCRMKGDWPEENIPLHMKVVNYEIIMVGVLGGIACTYAAVVNILTPNDLELPCFVHATRSST